MCISPFDAGFGLTTIAGHRLMLNGRPQHLLVYGNQPTNKHQGANAIILHIPVAEGAPLTPNNVLPTDGLARLTTDMWEAVPQMISREGKDRSLSFTPPAPIHVFQRGIYTWVLANRATPGQIADALELVPEAVRPQIGTALIEWYQQNFPNDALLIGCFNLTSGKAAEPVAVRYTPRNYSVMRMPAVDAHGTVPRLGDFVDVRHRLIVGVNEFPGIGGRVRYSERPLFHPDLAAVLPERVIGAVVREPMRNGDFYVDFGAIGAATVSYANAVTRSGGAFRAANGQAVPMALTAG